MTNVAYLVDSSERTAISACALMRDVSPCQHLKLE